MKRRFEVHFTQLRPHVELEADWYEFHMGAVAFLANKGVQDAPFLLVMYPAGSWSSICEICTT